MSLRPVIYLAYHYPPLGGVAVMRAMRFTRYLPEFGWKPIVVCVAGGAKEPRDPALVQEIPEQAVVERVPCLEPDNYPDTWDDPPRKVIRNLFKTFDFVLFPDDRALWARPASRAAIRLARQHRAEAVIATAQPWSTLVAGARVHASTGLPLVCDFRDDWTTSNADFRRRHPKRQAREEALEQNVLEASSAVITVTPGIVEGLRQRRPPSLAEEAIHLIPNGFDPAHFEPRLEPVADQPFTILHAGGIHPQRDMRAFLDGFEQWLAAHPERRARLILAGRVEAACQTWLERPALEGVLDVRGFLPHAQIRQLMMTSHVQLLVLEQVPTAAWLFTGKAFEYIGAGRPILMTGPLDCPLAEVVRATGNSRVCLDQPAQIAQSLEELYQQGPTSPNPEQQAHYDARRQTERLAGILTEVTR
ncbi:MAG: glycosyltransferase [Vulcanimicrobiota bacterium]